MHELRTRHCHECGAEIEYYTRVNPYKRAPMENIDQTQFLPPKTPLINPHRLAHGDLQGRQREDGTITYAEVKDVSIIAGLIERGFLEEYHKSYGITLLELQKAFYAPLSGDHSNYGHTGSGNGAERYHQLRKAMGIDRLNVINRAMTHNYASDTAAHRIEGISVYRSTFEMLVKEIDELREEVLANG